MSAEHRWDVRQLNLEAPLPAIEPADSTEGAYLQLWWRTLPIGHLWLPRESLPIRPVELRLRVARAVAPTIGNYLFASGFRAPLPTIVDNPARDRLPDLSAIAALSSPLSALEKHLCTSAGAPSRVSVLVCTYRRPDYLRRCLASLTALDPPATEIIVVDNAPQGDETSKLVGEFKCVTYCSEPTTGLSRARNTGLRRTTCEIVAWTDDDAIVHPTWIHAIRQVFSDSTIFGMTGLVMPAELETASQIRFERDFGGFNRGYRQLDYDFEFFSEMRERGVPVWKIGAGANMAFRRNVFDLVGLFEERLGAGAAGCSEDSEIWYRILANQLKIRYEPRAVVWHSHRIDGEAFRRQMEQYMRGHVASLLVQFEKFHHFGNLRRLLVSLPNHYWRVVTGREHGTARGTIWFEILGCFRGALFYLRSLKATRLPSRPSMRIKANPMQTNHKRRRSAFLAENPFPNPFTNGLFYREKMRAIHRVAPDCRLAHILEVGGGRSGLGRMLYPDAIITNIDINPEYAADPCNNLPGVAFVCGDATRLPFKDETFDAVTMFDLIEHVPDDAAAIREGFRVLKAGGYLLLSTPNADWRYPHYSFMQAFCPPEEKLFTEWGHVRRGYTRQQIDRLIGLQPERTATFINALTVLSHDIGFSNLSPRKRKLLWLLLAPITLTGYVLHRPWVPGTETAYCWRKPG